MGEWLQIKSSLPEVRAIVLGTIGDYKITNTLMAGIAVTLILTIFALIFRAKYKPANQVPGKLQTALEMIYELFFGYLHQMSQSKSATLKVIPLVGTLFFAIYLSNILTSIPPFSFLTYENAEGAQSMFRAYTSDFNTTFGIAGTLILVTHTIGFRNKGIIEYFNSYLPVVGVIRDSIKQPRTTLANIANYPIQQFIGILDVIGELAKPFSMSLRLFGNIFAGEVMTVVFFGLLAPFVPALWWMLGLFTAAIQSLVFGSLITNAFLGFMDVEKDGE